MKPNLSIILPSIRPYNLERLYNSILEATVESFELVVVGPYDLPKELRHYRNIKVFRDYGSPVRCSNIAGCLSEGNYVSWCADDAIYLPNSIDLCLDKLRLLEKECSKGENIYDCCISAKYLEGETGSFSIKEQPDSFYKLCNAYPRANKIQDDWNILNVGFMSLRLFRAYGGWDNDFEACPLAHADLAARLQYYGVIVGLADIAVLKCDHLEGVKGDHGPIHHAQLEADTPKYIQKWNSDWIQNPELLDWIEYPSIWNRRFSSDN